MPFPLILFKNKFISVEASDLGFYNAVKISELHSGKYFMIFLIEKDIEKITKDIYNIYFTNYDNNLSMWISINQYTILNFFCNFGIYYKIFYLINNSLSIM